MWTCTALVDKRGVPPIANEKRHCRTEVFTVIPITYEPTRLHRTNAWRSVQRY